MQRLALLGVVAEGREGLLSLLPVDLTGWGMRGAGCVVCGVRCEVRGAGCGVRGACDGDAALAYFFVYGRPRAVLFEVCCCQPKVKV